MAAARRRWSSQADRQPSLRPDRRAAGQRRDRRARPRAERRLRAARAGQSFARGAGLGRQPQRLGEIARRRDRDCRPRAPASPGWCTRCCRARRSAATLRTPRAPPLAARAWCARRRSGRRPAHSRRRSRPLVCQIAPPRSGRSRSSARHAVVVVGGGGRRARRLAALHGRLELRRRRRCRRRATPAARAPPAALGATADARRAASIASVARAGGREQLRARDEQSTGARRSLGVSDVIQASASDPRRSRIAVRTRPSSAAAIDVGRASARAR